MVQLDELVLGREQGHGSGQEAVYLGDVAVHELYAVQDKRVLYAIGLGRPLIPNL